MAKYRVIAASVNIHAGVLGLEPHQARARLHRLRPIGGNQDTYEVIDPPVMFKRGEVFEYEGELPKHLVESVMSCPSTEGPFPVLDAEIVTEAAPDDGVADAPVGAALVAARSGQPQGLPLQVTDSVPKRKKGPRAEKPAA